MNSRQILAALVLATASGAALAGGGVYPPAADTAVTRTRAEVTEQMRSQAPNFRGDNYPLPVEVRPAPAGEAAARPADARRGAVVAWPLNAPHAGA